MKRKYSIAVTLPLTLRVEVKTTDDQQAIEKARRIALKTPYKDWGNDFSTAKFNIVKD